MIDHINIANHHSLGLTCRCSSLQYCLHFKSLEIIWVVFFMRKFKSEGQQKRRKTFQVFTLQKYSHFLNAIKYGHEVKGSITSKEYAIINYTAHSKSSVLPHFVNKIKRYFWINWMALFQLIFTTNQIEILNNFIQSSFFFANTRRRWQFCTLLHVTLTGLEKIPVTKNLPPVGFELVFVLHSPSYPRFSDWEIFKVPLVQATFDFLDKDD